MYIYVSLYTFIYYTFTIEKHGYKIDCADEHGYYNGTTGCPLTRPKKYGDLRLESLLSDEERAWNRVVVVNKKHIATSSHFTHTKNKTMQQKLASTHLLYPAIRVSNPWVPIFGLGLVHHQWNVLETRTEPWKHEPPSVVGLQSWVNLGLSQNRRPINHHKSTIFSPWNMAI